MSETTIVSIIVAALMALPQVLAQFVLFMQNRTHDRKIDENTIVTKATEAKADALVQKTAMTDKKVDAVGGALADVKAEAKVIAGHVNSSATAAVGQIEALQKELILQRSLISDMKETAALLAQAASIQRAIAAEPIHVEVNNVPSAVKHKANEPESQSPEASLKRIDQHTEQIEKNTASTEAKVEALKSEDR